MPHTPPLAMLACARSRTSQPRHSPVPSSTTGPAAAHVAREVADVQRVPRDPCRHPGERSWRIVDLVVEMIVDGAPLHGTLSALGSSIAAVRARWPVAARRSNAWTRLPPSARLPAAVPPGLGRDSWLRLYRGPHSASTSCRSRLSTASRPRRVTLWLRRRRSLDFILRALPGILGHGGPCRLEPDGHMRHRVCPGHGSHRSSTFHK